jgi:hypothetical protein
VKVTIKCQVLLPWQSNVVHLIDAQPECTPIWGSQGPKEADTIKGFK